MQTRYIALLPCIFFSPSWRESSQVVVGRFSEPLCSKNRKSMRYDCSVELVVAMRVILDLSCNLHTISSPDFFECLWGIGPNKIYEGARSKQEAFSCCHDL